MSNQNLAYNQRVLCFALRKMTKDTELVRNGFLHWHKTLSKLEFDVDSVVKELVDYLGVGVDEKKTLMLTMHTARNKLFDDLPPVPAVLLNMLDGSAAPSSTTKADGEMGESAHDDQAAAKSSHWLVTDQFLQYLILQLRKFDKDSLAELKNSLLSEGIEDLRDSVRLAVKKWASSGFEKMALPDDVSESDCYDITHGVYMLMVDIVGPVESDRMVNKAIDETLKLDAAGRFSPQNLL